jgi:hypothetical protein
MTLVRCAAASEYDHQALSHAASIAVAAITARRRTGTVQTRSH